MKRYGILILICVLLISLVINFYQFLSSKDENVYEKNYKNFEVIVKSIIESYEYDGYIESLGHYSHMLALPIAKSEAGFLSRQKLFVYKNDTLDAVVLLSVTASMFNDEKDDEWKHSFDYNYKLINESKDTQYPHVAVASNAFSHNGCNIKILAISHYDGEEVNIASQELINFSNDFIKFLKNI